MSFLLTLLGFPKLVFGWLFDDWRRVAALLLLIVCASGWYRAWLIDGDRDRWRFTASAEQAAHVGTVLNYRMAAIHAQQIAFANRVIVEARWRAQYEEAVDAKAAFERDYRANLAVWLRRTAAPASVDGGADGASVPASAGATGGADHDATAAIVPIIDLERCAAAFAHLSALIGWLKSASSVEAGGESVHPASSPDGMARPL